MLHRANRFVVIVVVLSSRRVVIWSHEVFAFFFGLSGEAKVSSSARGSFCFTAESHMKLKKDFSKRTRLGDMVTRLTNRIGIGDLPRFEVAWIFHCPILRQRVCLSPDQPHDLVIACIHSP